jgi:hypothetical protein
MDSSWNTLPHRTNPLSLEAIGLGLTALTIVVGATWKLSGDIQRLSGQVDLIMNNHLKHIQDDITGIKDEQNRLRDRFDREN